jgi:hypothetical protein
MSVSSIISSTHPTSLGKRLSHLAIQAASSQRASLMDRLSVTPAQFLLAVIISLARRSDRHSKADVIVGDDELDAV